MKNIRFVEEAPPVAVYQKFRRIVGWAPLSDSAAAKGLQNALYSVYALKGKEIIGCGRIVGDGAIYFYIQDIIVLPEYQGRGLGWQIMEYIMRYLEINATKNAFIGLMAAKDVASVYEKFGFEKRPENRPGMYRMWNGE